MRGKEKTTECTACDRDCEATFRCHECRQLKNVCHHKAGGFDADEDICEVCFFRRVMLLQNVVR